MRLRNSKTKSFGILFFVFWCEERDAATMPVGGAMPGEVAIGEGVEVEFVSPPSMTLTLPSQGMLMVAMMLSPWLVICCDPVSESVLVRNGSW